MKLHYCAILCLIFSCVLSSCKNNTDANNNDTGLSGTIYYNVNSLDGLYKFDLSTDGTPVKIGSNFEAPNVLANGWILGRIFDGSQITIGEMSPDGAQTKTILKPIPAYSEYYQASPDGNYVAYDDGGIWTRVYVIDMGGNTVATFGDGTAQNSFASPCWGPDGTLYLSGESSNYGIFTCGKNFAAPERIDPNLTNPVHPRVSPDGKRIIFSLNQGHLWVMNTDGTNAAQITTGDGTEDYPVWSPDGKWVAAYSSPSDQFVAVKVGTTTVVQFKDSYTNFRNSGFVPSMTGQFDWK